MITKEFIEKKLPIKVSISSIDLQYPLSLYSFNIKGEPLFRFNIDGKDSKLINIDTIKSSITHALDGKIDNVLLDNLTENIFLSINNDQITLKSILSLFVPNDTPVPDEDDDDDEDEDEEEENEDDEDDENEDDVEEEDDDENNNEDVNKEDEQDKTKKRKKFDIKISNLRKKSKLDGKSPDIKKKVSFKFDPLLDTEKDIEKDNEIQRDKEFLIDGWSKKIFPFIQKLIEKNIIKDEHGDLVNRYLLELFWGN